MPWHPSRGNLFSAWSPTGKFFLLPEEWATSTPVLSAQGAAQPVEEAAQQPHHHLVAAHFSGKVMRAQFSAGLSHYFSSSPWLWKKYSTLDMAGLRSQLIMPERCGVGSWIHKSEDHGEVWARDQPRWIAWNHPEKIMQIGESRGQGAVSNRMSPFVKAKLQSTHY